MDPTPLYYVWDYTDVDRAFWAEHLEAWLPERLIDAHVHVSRSADRKRRLSDAERRRFWVSEAADDMDAPTADRSIATCYPGRSVSIVAMGHPELSFDIEAANEYVAAECVSRGWHGLALLRPEWTADQAAAELAKPGVIGFKPYYSMLPSDKDPRDGLIESSIFDFLPHHILELLDDRRAWLTLHPPKKDRLPHPDNIREIKEIRRRYPNIVLVVAHLGRCYTEPHAAEGLPAFADDPGLYFDNSAVLNPAVHRIALQRLGPDRILYGTDNPVFYMRGRRQWKGREYINRTSYPFHFNKEREAPEIEAHYTLYMYEALLAFKNACEEQGIRREQIEAVFYGNAARLIRTVLDAKRERGESAPEGGTLGSGCGVADAT